MAPNPWDPDGARGSDYSRTPATASSATPDTATAGTADLDWVRRFFGEDGEAVVRRLVDNGVSLDCIAACLLNLWNQGVGAQLWQEVWSIARLLVTKSYRPSHDSDATAAYRELSVCGRLLFLKLASCLTRCAGLHLAADLFDYWLTGGASRKASTESIGISLPDGTTSSVTRTFFPLAWREIDGRVQVRSELLQGLAKAGESVRNAICERLRDRSGARFPSAEADFLDPRPGSVSDGDPLRYPPSENALLVRGAQTLYVETSANFGADPELKVIGTVAILSEFEVTATRVRVQPLSSSASEIVAVGDEEERPDEHQYGYRVELQGWRARLWDFFDFHLGVGLELLGVRIGDSFFDDLETGAVSCKALPGVKPTAFWILSESWRDVLASTGDLWSDRVLFLPDGGECQYQSVGEGGTLVPQGAFGI